MTVTISALSRKFSCMSLYRPMWKLLPIVLLAFACRAGVTKPAAKGDPCRKVYEQCRLPDGPLGVCHETPCSNGQPAPCLVCVSQH